MLIKQISSLAMLLFAFANYSFAQALQSPDSFLGYKLGSRFTPHHQLVEYFRYMSEASDKVNLVEYGSTYELRPLIAVIISHPNNLRRIDAIRENNLRRTGLLSGNPQKEDIAIVQLSYSIHGNEAAGSESSMAVLYALASGGTEIDKWLDNTIVIIDPSQNPDGYNRYTNWNNQVSNFPFDAYPETREHAEPWPGGRVNHYYFDLNRDWVWQTQKESRDRIRFYHSWMPHVHADVHEMYGESSYYFAPAAQPYHPYLTQWQGAFQVDIGKNHASYFDREGWRYFTKEYFDLFYPSFGDTYPMLAGSIGMTYEQAGHGAAGRAYLINNGDTLKLSDRIAHHFTTSLSTIEVASKNAGKLVEEFSNYFRNAIEKPTGEYQSYIISASNASGRIHDLMTLLDRQGIKYGTLHQSFRAVKGYSFDEGTSSSYTPIKGDLIIPVAQPRSVLLNVLFEQEAALADSLTYDITAWSIPMAYGLKAFATAENVPYENYVRSKGTSIPLNARPYAYAIEWGSVPSTSLLARLIHRGITARYATSSFTVNKIQYAPGTVLVMRADNKKMFDFDDIVIEEAATSVVPVTQIATGFVENGKDLGSDAYPLVRKPEVLTIAGEGISAQSLGQVWHFFEEELMYPIHIIEWDQIQSVNLDRYNVIILPEGFYHLEKDFLTKLSAWARSGGQVIAIGSALNQFAGKEGFAIKSGGTEKMDSLKIEDPAHYPEAFDAGLRKSISGEINGAVFKTVIDRTHPLSFGLGSSYWTLKTTSTSVPWLPSGNNAVYLNDNLVHYGFAGKKALEKIDRTLIAGREPIGGGGIVYFVDNPLFRSFWNSGKVLFSNALFF